MQEEQEKALSGGASQPYRNITPEQAEELAIDYEENRLLLEEFGGAEAADRKEGLADGK